MSRLRDDGCYRSKARLFRDSDLAVWIRWFIVPDGTPWMPTPHLWGGKPWRAFRQKPTNGPGELMQSPLVWTPGFPPTRPQPWVGENDWWANGAPISALGAGTAQIRPGVCPKPVQQACCTSCDVFPTMSAVWQMEEFSAIGTLTPQVLVNVGDCVFSSNCYQGCPEVPQGMAAAWLVDIDQEIPGLSSAVITPQGPCSFSTCCPSTLGAL